MPQLAKGGKWVFGWVVVSRDGAVRLPPQAAAEYGFEPEMALAFMRGSRTSGGFGLGKQALLASHPYLSGRLLCQGFFQADGTVFLPVELGMKAGERLLVVRGSGHALGFTRHGPIYELARQHTEIEEFIL
jgi:hypothetical protein